MIKIAVYDKNHKCIAENKDEIEVHLLLHREYQMGDRIIIEAEEKQHLRVKLEASIETATVYSSGGRFEFEIPFGEKRMPYPQGAFEGDYHILDVAQVLPSQLSGYRDLSTNPIDIHGDTSLFPHCSASVETRDESIFAARNTIDGLIETDSHGVWPFTSWGDNEDPNAEIWIDFGRPVIINQVAINLRSDFPHDNYWKTLDIVVGDDKIFPVQLKKTGHKQYFDLGEVKANRVKLCKLVKNEKDPSPFPALTHWQVFGFECQDQ